MKHPIVVMIGGGSKLPKIINESKKKDAKFYISLVVSHKKNSDGINLALKKNIPAIFFRLTDFKQLSKNKNSRKDYMENLGLFISQHPYNPKLIVFAGWDLIMDKNFFKFFRSKLGNGFCAINLHPALLPVKREKFIQLPDATKSPIIKGMQKAVLKRVLSEKLTYFGPTVHFMIPDKYDTGKVINREFIKINKNDNTSTLKKKLMPAEDKILIDSINKVLSVENV